MGNQHESPPRVEIFLHEAINGRLNQKHVQQLDPASRDLIKAIHSRYRRRSQAEAQLRRLRSGQEFSSYQTESLVFTLLADYVIDMALRREEKRTTNIEQHRQRLQRLWAEYKARVLRYGY